MVWEVAEAANSHFLFLSSTEGSLGNRGKRTHAGESAGMLDDWRKSISFLFSLSLTALPPGLYNRALFDLDWFTVRPFISILLNLAK